MSDAPRDPGDPEAVHLAHRGDIAGICGRSTGSLTSDPGDYDCSDCDAAYVGIMHADSEREYMAMREATLHPEALEQIKQATGWDGTPAPATESRPGDGMWPPAWAALYAERRRDEFDRLLNGDWPAPEAPADVADYVHGEAASRRDDDQGWISGSCG